MSFPRGRGARVDPREASLPLGAGPQAEHCGTKWGFTIRYRRQIVVKKHLLDLVGGESGIRCRSRRAKHVAANRKTTRAATDGASATEGGGESGIRTHGRVSPTHAFQACSFNHSDISPIEWNQQFIANRSFSRMTANQRASALTSFSSAKLASASVHCVSTARYSARAFATSPASLEARATPRRANTRRGWLPPRPAC